ncbi:4-hydroxy-tetrahydrodipicolinate synthase [Spongiivirga citrea]|uniref:4-hydroxy-tetrahydrodipicolinate synthase n=1 Tax=Spongiivirga citrea TaxID=1481457 RepID=A0A6M0CP22_9FLAO|nr:4-hydroxy-tetrahydrodipicolinate synthase [Spongiivirga citrea]NER17619.1 4-hydroxy-tetrahydrodipicolinate synthase [Spongiivirga citrea]
MNTLRGTGVALVTPFNDDFSIDTTALANLVDFVIEGGVNYLVVLGTTGEGATLNKTEQQLVIDTITKANNNRLPMVLGIGGNNTAQVVETIKNTDLNDFAAILSVSPYYNKPNQEGLYRHFEQIALASPKPIIMYNVPGRTSMNMLPETVVRLANNFENLIGVKEAGNNIMQGMQLVKDTPDDFLVISGDDDLALNLTLSGGDGVISVMGQGTPVEFSKMIQLGLEGNSKEAFVLYYKLMEGIKMIFEDGNPAGIKTILTHRGIIKNVVRLPLVKANQDLRARLEAFVDGL